MLNTILCIDYLFFVVNNLLIKVLVKLIMVFFFIITDNGFLQLKWYIFHIYDMYHYMIMNIL